MIVRNLNDVRKRRVKEIEGEEERWKKECWERVYCLLEMWYG
jgi:hypothetical protein